MSSQELTLHSVWGVLAADSVGPGDQCVSRWNAAFPLIDVLLETRSSHQLLCHQESHTKRKRETLKYSSEREMMDSESHRTERRRDHVIRNPCLLKSIQCTLHAPVLVGQAKEVVSYLEIWVKVILTLKGLINSE